MEEKKIKAKNNSIKTKKESKTEWKYFYRGMCTVFLSLLGAASFLFVWFNFVEEKNVTGHLLGYGNLTMAVMIYILFYFIIGKWMRAFQIGVERSTNIVASQVMTFFVADFLEVFASMAITGQWRYMHLFVILYFKLWIVQGVIFGIIVLPLIYLYRILFLPIDIIEIYGNKNGLYNKVNTLTYKYSISEMIYIKDYKDNEILDKIQKHQAVLINDIPSKQKNMIVKECFDMNKRLYVVPKISDIIMKSSQDLNLLDTPLYLCRNSEINILQRAIKRAMDIGISIIALVILSPVMLITSIAIHIEDGGPVFFKQERVTENGKRFNIVKFRSMIVNAEADGRPHPAGENDDRITKTGRFIRMCRIDELPQFINILMGDMSVVGPRPERVEHVEKYTKSIPEFEYRLKMKGGLTGYAQVYGKYNTSALDKLKLDLIYITNYSLLTDVQIIFETVKILFLKESTEGFN